jgi:hypothetical protein
MIQILGVMLIIIALILGLIQHFMIGGINFYGVEENKWYFYGVVGVIGLIGIIAIAWTYIKK